MAYDRYHYFLPIGSIYRSSVISCNFIICLAGSSPRIPTLTLPRTTKSNYGAMTALFDQEARRMGNKNHKGNLQKSPIRKLSAFSADFSKIGFPENRHSGKLVALRLSVYAFHHVGGPAIQLCEASCYGFLDGSPTHS